MSLSLNEKLCSAQDSLLLIIDIQERLVSAMPEEVIATVIKNNNILIRAANELDIPIIHTEQYPKGLGSTVADIADNLSETLKAITKTHFSCASAEGFNELVAKHQRKQIIIGGMESHVCVLQSAIQLQRQGYTIYVVEDAVCSRQKLHHRNALQRLQQNGVVISNVESVLFEWIRDAAHPTFKTLSKLIK